MNRVLRNILAVITGLVAGSIVNGILITTGPMMIAPPEGIDLTTKEGLQAGMHLMTPKHFIFPFLAHALGTLTGSFLAAKISVGNKMRYAFIIGFFFLFGGVWAATAIPAPMWFIIIDLIFAYLVMAWAGGRLGGGGKEEITEK